jgi:hypothetical protein
MKLVLLLFAFGLFSLTQTFTIPERKVASVNNQCTSDMSRDYVPRCWTKRSEAVVNVLLVHYGSEMDLIYLKEIGQLYQERFALANDKKIQIKILESLILPLKDMKRDLESIKAKIGGDDSKKGPKRLERLWYYYQDISIADEIHKELLKNPTSVELLKAADTVVVLSAPQIDGLAYLTGAFSLIEYPTEIAWKVDGGSTDYEDKYKLVDKMIHETGHLLGLDHPADHCTQILDLKQRLECCKSSPGGQDVVSYCRDRNAPNKDFFHKFTGCTQKYLTETTLPSLLSGGKRHFQEQNCL